MIQGKGRYMYGVAASGKAGGLGPIGIEGNPVYTVPYEGFCAIVHSCPAEPYQSGDEQVVKNWVRTHQVVLDAAKKELGGVIPMGFDTILQPKDDTVSPDEVVRDWLRENYERLQSIMDKIKERDEYGVQIFYEAGLIGKQICEQSQEIRTMREEIAAKSPGAAYLYKQKLEKAIRAEMERLASERFRDFYSRIRPHCDDIVVDKTRKVDRNRIMLVNLSCLVAKEKVDCLGEELEKINSAEGFSVHFSGPWPPYSFVARPAVLAKEEMK